MEGSALVLPTLRGLAPVYTPLLRGPFDVGVNSVPPHSAIDVADGPLENTCSNSEISVSRPVRHVLHSGKATSSRSSPANEDVSDQMPLPGYFTRHSVVKQ